MEEILLIIVLSFIAATISSAVGFRGISFIANTNKYSGLKATVPRLTISQIFSNGWFGRPELRGAFTDISPWKPYL